MVVAVVAFDGAVAAAVVVVAAEEEEEEEEGRDLSVVFGDTTSSMGANVIFGSSLSNEGGE